MMKQRILVVMGLSALALAVVGCSAPVGEVTGVVRYRGVALTSGTITFKGADGKEVPTAIGTDGRYLVSGVAPGQAKVAVESHPRVPAGMMGGAKPTEKVTTVPDRYHNPETSGLVYSVTRGRQTKDFDLDP